MWFLKVFDKRENAKVVLCPVGFFHLHISSPVYIRVSIYLVGIYKECLVGNHKCNKFWDIFYFSDSCITQSTASIPDYCILKCMQILFDSKCCSSCEIGTDFWEKIKKNKQILLEKIRLELCLGKVLSWPKINTINCSMFGWFIILIL